MRAADASQIVRAHDALASVVRHRAFGDHVGPGAVVERVAEGFRLAKARPSPWSVAGQPPMRVIAPARAGDPMRIVNTDAPDAWIEIASPALSKTDGVAIDNAVVYSAAATETDLVTILERSMVEEVRVLRTPLAAGDARWTLRIGPGVSSVALSDDRVLVRDHAGRVRLESTPMFAIDARGRKRVLHPKLTSREREIELDVSLDAKDLVYPIAIDPLWTTTPATMLVTRTGYGATVLPSGDVLVAAGFSQGNYTPTAEIYDAKTATWSATASLNKVRFLPAALRFGSKVLVAAGDDADIDRTAEIYDEAAKTWTLTAPMKRRHPSANAFLLPSGRILVGCAESVSTSEIYDPGADTWTEIAQPRGMGRFTSTQLPSGSVFAISAPETATVFDVSTGAWRTVAPPLTRLSSMATVVAIGGTRVLVNGGKDDLRLVTSRSSIYDSSTNTWSKAASSPQPHEFRPAVRLPSGLVLFAGGLDDATDPASSAEVYDARSDAWFPAGSMVHHHGTTPQLLADGRAIVAGGYSISGELSAVEIFDPLPNGSACTSLGECRSAYCADGVCCDASCTGPCQACNLTGKAGTCSGITGAVHVGRSCGVYATCTAGACDASCASDASCTATHHCVGSACTLKKDNGAACGAARECASGFCVDSVCCSSTCGGQCEACDVAGKVGVCWPAGGKPHGGRPSCLASGDAECGAQCDGSDRTKCVVGASTQPCSENACTDGKESHARFCDGAGKCLDTATSCGSYACAATSCRTSCTAGSDCAAGFYCNGGACVPREGLGKSCATSDACGAALFCTDGVCCGSAACPAGSSCVKTSATTASCEKNNGVACAADTECASGRCVDGVCCDGACDGQCQACDVEGLAGKCAPVKGAPHGGRGACPKDTTNVCASAACDGVEVTKCAELVKGEVECRPASCEAGTATSVARCDGSGKCPTAVTQSCAGFACDPIAKGCRTSCSAPADCVTGYSCEAGACKPSAGTCSADEKELVAADGTRTPCDPYVCLDDRCVTECNTSSACAVGFVCDTSTKSCTPLPAAEPSGGDGGCSTGGPSRGFGAVWALVFAVPLAFARRRRALLAAIALAPACAPSRSTDPSTDDTIRIVARSLERTVGDAWDRLGKGRTLERRADGFHLAHAQPRSLDATLPPRADGWVRLVPYALDGFFLDLRDEDARAVHGIVREGALVFSDVGEHAHLVLSMTANGLEELRLFETARPKIEIHQRARTTGRLRVRNGRIEAVDELHRVRVFAEPPWAVDARGVRRALTVRVEGDDRLVSTLDVDGLAFPVVVDPAWTSPVIPRNYQDRNGLAVLPSGKILALGSQTNGPGSAAELFDPAARAWSTTSFRPVAREGAFMVALEGGKVLVGGGVIPGTETTTELYDPTTPSWSSGPSLTVAGDVFTHVALLSTGHVLRVTGLGALKADLLSPSGGFTSVPAPRNRFQPTLTALPGGRALIASGDVIDSSAEVFDVATRTWSDTASMSSGRQTHAAVALTDGRVLVAAGRGPGGRWISTAEIYDPTTNTWKPTAPMIGRRAQFGLALLTNGRALAAGGKLGAGPLSTVEIYDPTSNKWLPTSPMIVPRYETLVAPIPGGGAVVVGASAVTESHSTSELFEPMPNGASCSLPGDCASGFCVDGACCVTDVCAQGRTCGRAGKGGTCSTLDGQPCGSAAECGSGFCVDSVCCDAACGGLCEACDVLASKGTCTKVKGGTHGTRAPCEDGGGDACRAKQCDGVDATKCNGPPAGTVSCGTSACATGIETHTSTCDGSGKCSDVPKGCGAYACSGSLCRSSCAAEGDCAAGYYCKSSVCSALESLGATCAGVSACGKGLFCVDGVCCGSASCDADSTCAAAGKAGTCTKKSGAKCSLDAECGSGPCVDGVCCESKCDGQCEACALPGRLGTCAPVKGAPHGSRAKCEGDSCAARLCDGTDRAKCAGWVGVETACRVATCIEGKATSGATCDGMGSCPAATTVDCLEVRCDPATSACRTSCTSAAECASGFDCMAGACKPITATCSEDLGSARLPDGTSQRCYPLVCRAGACLSQCVASTDCAPGFVCDAVEKTCVAGAPAATEGDGGCAHGRTADSRLAIPLLALAMGLTRRARRQASRRRQPEIRALPATGRSR